MKKLVILTLVLSMMFSLFVSVQAKEEPAFDYASRKAELESERNDLYDWYANQISEIRQGLVEKYGLDAVILGPTPGVPEKYITQIRTYSAGYLIKDPSPESIDYEDEFYIGSLSKIDVRKRDVVPVFTDYIVTYGGYVHLKDCYQNMPKKELEEKMKAYYLEKASEPLFETKAR